MPDTYVLLSKVTVGAAGAASIDFTNIPQTGYTDLLISLSSRGTSGSFPNPYIQFNGDTASNYRWRGLYGDGVSAASNNSTSATGALLGVTDGSSDTANTFGNTQFYISNYTSSNQKSISSDSIGEANTTYSYMYFTAGLWTGTSAITSIKLVLGGGNFAANSTAYLYGISNVNTTPTKAPKASGGDIITNDGTYWIHTFLSSGTFTPQSALSCDYLVVAGGGGGGANKAGGGGAGGLRSTVTATGGGGALESKLSLNSSTNYTVTIGAGGAGVGTSYGNNGSNSVFSTITATGGGGGANYDGANKNTGNTGGSGGGGNGSDNDTAGFGGNGTSNQGYAGGNGLFINTSTAAGGGGGGAGAVGAAGSGTNLAAVGGAGGNGVTTSISGLSVTYAGGGGGGVRNGTGGTGGTGGGGAGNAGGTATAGTANSGGGGGATGQSNNAGANGGSGIVIIRYAM